MNHNLVKVGKPTRWPPVPLRMLGRRFCLGNPDDKIPAWPHIPARAYVPMNKYYSLALPTLSGRRSRGRRFLRGTSRRALSIGLVVN